MGGFAFRAGFLSLREKNSHADDKYVIIGRKPMELTALSLTEAAELIRQRKISPLELTRACLDRVEQIDGRLNSFVTLTAEAALRQAQQATENIGQGDYRGPLHGIPIAL